MKTIPVDELATGHVLATDIVSASGQVLCKKGLSINESHIRFIKNFGVTVVSIQGEAFDMSSVPAEILQVAQAMVNQRFKHNLDSHPLVAEVKKVALIHVAQSLMHSTA